MNQLQCRGRRTGYRDRSGAARLKAAGYPTTEQDSKNALLAKRALPEHLVAADTPGVREFVAAVLALWPGSNGGGW